MIYQNSLGNRDLTVSRKGIVIEELAETVNFNDDGFNVALGTEAEVLVSLRQRTMNNNVSRSLNTNYVISSDRDVMCNYSFRFVAVSNIGGGQFPTIDVQIRATTGDSFVTIASTQAGVSGSVLGLGTTINANIPVSFYVPKGWQVRLTSSGTGTPSILHAQEILL